jgi:penicillin-binding protein 1A
VQQSAERALDAQRNAIEAGTYGPYRHQTYAAYLEQKAESEDEAGPTNSPYLQGLAVTLEAKTGYILAMVGGRDFVDSKFNRATQALRQPGSTFKPIVYTAALRAGVPLTTVMVDEPITVQMPGSQPPWEPQNYDNTLRGRQAREALYKSVNIVTISLAWKSAEGHRGGHPLRAGGVALHCRPRSTSGPRWSPLELIAAYTAYANQERATTDGHPPRRGPAGTSLAAQARLEPVMIRPRSG